MERVYISIGSNLDRSAHVRAGLTALRARFGPLAVSTIYECPAVGFDGDPFYNCVVAFDSDEAVGTVHADLHAIEDRYGRDRSQPKFSPRTLDLDLLLYGDRIIREGRLTLPRPDIDQVAFVLAPLAELAAERVHPAQRASFTELWARFEGPDADDLVPIDPNGIVPPEVLE